MAKTPLDQEILQVFNYCRSNCAKNERWPSYYRRRYLEFCSYLELFPKKKFENVLELGCGIGYQSAFLSKISTNVMATDLEDENIDAHAPGMKKAKDLLEQLDVKNVELQSCSAESLPFPDETFDMVYSSHVLEHIPDRTKALNEIYRVLKVGGIHFCVVPTTMEKVYAFINFYTYLIGRIFFHITKKMASIFKDNSNLPSSSDALKSVGSSSSLLKFFPFPPPHGESKHYLSELVEWTPGKWSADILSKTPFVLLSQSTTQLNPLLSLLGGLLPNLGTRIHELTRRAEIVIGKWPVFRSLGVNTVMVFEKRNGDS